MKIKNIVLAGVIILALILSSCGGAIPSQQTSAGQPTATIKPSIVRIGWTGGPDSLNIGVAWLAATYTIYQLAYDSMYILNLDGTFTLDVADSVSRSNDGLTYTYKIKQGIKWHDGQSLTAKDVAFTYNLNKTHDDFPTIHSYTDHFVSIDAPDDTTVIIKLDQAIPNIESKLVFQYILPEHIWKDHAGLPAATPTAQADSATATPIAESNSAADFQNLELIGSGPFKLKEYKQNEYIDLVANPDYFRGAPKVSEVIFQVFPSPDVMVQALKTGQVDMITDVPTTSVATLKTAQNVKVVTGAPFAPGLTDIVFNQVDPKNCPKDAGGVCSGHPALRDKNMRLALAYATDKQQLISVVMLGLASPGVALIPDGMGAWFNSSIKDFGYDVAKANKLLDDGGYKDTNGDGIRETPDGKSSLTFRLNWPTSSTVAPRMADMLAEMWSKIGVKLEPQALEDNALTAKCCPGLDYDIFIWGWVADPDPNTLLIIPTTDQISTGYNETGYSNSHYDELYTAQGVELDKTKRQQMVWEMQQIMHDDVVYLIPFYSKAVEAYRTDRYTGWLDDQTKLALEDVSSLIVIEPVKK